MRVSKYKGLEMIYNTVKGQAPKTIRTDLTAEIMQGSVKWKNGVDLRTQIKEIYPDMIDYEFEGGSIIVYRKEA